MSQYPQLPGWKEPTTSRDAALAIYAPAKNLRERVLTLLQSLAPDDGLTADQIAVRLQRSPLSIRPRVSELAAAGKVRQTGHRSKNESGMTAHRWRAA
jgi:predicted ArsR family transcriptional regulator